MAVCNVPGTVVKVVLEEDLKKPEEEQTQFHIAVLTMSQQRAIKRAVLRSGDQGFIDEVYNLALGTPGRPTGLVGWENFRLPTSGEMEFDKQTFRNHLSDAQEDLLVGKVMTVQMLGRDDRKN